MAPRRCVVQDCNRVADNELGISMHSSPTNGSVRMQWKRFVCQHRKISIRRVRLVYAPCISPNDCFIRAVHIKGTERRIKPGSFPTVLEKCLCFSRRMMMNEILAEQEQDMNVEDVELEENAVIQADEELQAGDG
ncbi:hypothetical protein OS493_039257 [Desmophyllum pertusum]|uniref:THAP-type domain-containing protein n=1 Tax=Desmophyllum pertusum TaxID=174260 RepID=A0A9W9ZH98_9CNID|nr:hypothetical protein OS493_039257 [Desmophyllum pertusum]